MATTATYRVFSPTASTKYIMPDGFWVRPSSGSSISATAVAFNSDGSHFVESSFTVDIENISAGTTPGTQTNAGVFSENSVWSDSNMNGSNVWSASFTVSNTCHHVDISFAYTGIPYQFIRIRRSGAWSLGGGPNLFDRRSGAWTQLIQEHVRRSGTWHTP